MREKTRRFVIRMASAVLLVAASLLVGLRIGRPVFYTDGQAEVPARALAAAGMLRWETPEAQLELPGPVQGRLARLPDGRLVYGRSQEDGTTDLVIWDPARPAVPPEPAYGLNTEHNELAPALGPDGRLYFASDRPDGAGGYDLYVAQWGATGFGRPAPLAACNTARDESDPAPSDNGEDLVFVRIDRSQDDGNSGVLYRWRLGDAFDPAPVFATQRQRGSQPIDRDPAFAPGGGALWFVRKTSGEPLRLVRASVCAGAIDEPLPVGESWGTGELRAPMPLADGVHLGLLQPRRGETATDLWFQATATEVYPWWPGQRWLEWILIGIIATCVVLLVLLHLGRRWSTLDLVAQCLLLSLLLHILLFLWFMGVEISGALLRGEDEGSGMQVTVITASTSASGGMQAFELAAQVQFETQERSLAAAAPETATERATAAELAGPEAQWSSAAAPRDVAAETRVQDAAAAATQRTGQDPTAAPAEASLQSVERAAANAAQTARRAGAAAEAVEVVVPGGVMARASQSTASLAPQGQLEALPSPSERAAETPSPTMHDAGTTADAAAAPAPRAGRDVAAGAAIAAEATKTVEPAAATGSHATRTAADAAAVPSASAPAAAVDRDRAGNAALDAPAPEAGSALAPSKARAVGVPVALREGSVESSAPAATRREAGAAPAAPLTAVAATPEGPSDAAAEPTKHSAGTNGAPAEPATAAAAPSSQLSRGGASPAAAPQSAPVDAPLVAASSPRLKATPAALRDAAAAEPARPRTGSTANTDSTANSASTAGKAGKTAAPVAAALDVGVQGPRAPAADRPARGASASSSAAAMPGVSPPSSLLERAVQTAPRGPQQIAAAPASAYSNRFGPAKAKAIEQFGGSAETERAVANGLRYLAKIQKSDGFWGERDVFDDKYGQLYVGKTALCVLAFLGAGHTPTSSSEHSKVVAKALDQLLALQDEDTGAFGMSSSYGHGISTYAVAECYGLTKDPRLRRSLESALTWILQNQGPRRDKRNRGGWGYFSPGLRPEDDYARVSVTSWMVMALESARLSGVDLPPEVLPRAREYLEQSFDQPNGWFRYNHKPSRLQSAWPTLPASTPAGAFSLMLLGAPASDRMVQAAVTYTVERRPEAYRRYDDDDFVLRGQGNVYFWYYGTLCTFLAGGEAWERWNERLRELLPAAQAADGSFPPIDVYAREAGDTKADRSYSTAMCVLSLEIYYRYFTPLLLGR